MLAMLLTRLLKQAEENNSEYLFPSQKGPGHLSSIQKLVDAIGPLGERAVKPLPHNLRRTTANLGRIVLGSTQLAEEHILHFKSHMTGSTENYFSEVTKSFAKVRSNTYRSIYSHLDDLILSAGTLLSLGHGDDQSEWIDDLEAREGQPVCRDFISFGDQFLHFSNKGSPEKIGTFKDTNDFLETAYIRSPVASFCAGTDKYVKLSDRPLLQETIHLGWANYGDPIPRNLDDEIA